MLDVVPAPMNNDGNMADLPPHEAQNRELQGECVYQGPCLPLAVVLTLPHPCNISQVKNPGILFTPVKIYTREK